MFSRTPTKSSRGPSATAKEILWQAILLVAIAGLVGGALWNASGSLAQQGVASGFGFLGHTAGFDISQSLIPFSAVSTYGRAFLVGLLNTVEVTVIAIPLATILGFTVGISRRSSNWLLNRVAAAYVEVFRNTPLLLQLLFWYNAVLAALPAKALESLHLGNVIYLNRRGLALPQPVVQDFGGAWLVVAAAIAALFFLTARLAPIWRARTGHGFPHRSMNLLILFSLPLAFCLAIYLITGRSPILFNIPVMGRFSVDGGWQLLPEFVALLIGLIFYTASSIAEVVRSGLAAVPKGQYEAARSLHLPSGKIMRKVILPQAIRVIIPPLTNQYLNLLKNSSLAVAIGYPDLVQIFTGTVLNQTGQAVEIVFMTMAVYLTISLLTALGMNVYNRRIATVEN
ncbi:amino acid ABC transporter permease [Agrobacterium bohemicum]|uniref:Amino acid ABC transporter permease n=1 Tax=Agrobacterium bohemicum TaxID=2052828 RepID=A0A135NY84_9HYPH|nr:ABC transporter permease subunit [Agrobacterium bohemicum]KXG84114.1 amino acid ABC transporter permease [Agrobacterium bohemicum]